MTTGISFNKHNIQKEVTENQNPEQNSYRQIFKATSLFGGVQVFQIIIGIIRTKFVAVLLGTSGVGLMGLFNAPLQLILSVTGLGITFSAVREISEANNNNNPQNVGTAVTILKRWSVLSAILGIFVTVAIAPLLSKWTFGNKSYTWAFIFLSATLFFQTLSKGQNAILQGTRQLSYLARSSVYGSLLALFTSVPLFYIFEIKGIVPSLIITAFTSLLLSWYFVNKVKIFPVKMSIKDSLLTGKNMIKLGLVITFTGILGFLTAYILNAFISRTGGVDQVGLYNAGWSIIGQSTGLVFAAMTTDYFPRLSGINKDNQKITALVNQQAAIVQLFLGPIITILILAMPFLIRLLYTSAFLPMTDLAMWMLIGTIFKGLVWPVGFIFPAKGELKLFGLIEVSSTLFNVVASIIGYKLNGLEGLGISYIIGHLFGFALTIYYARNKYGFKYDKTIVVTFFISIVLISSVSVISHYMNGMNKYIAGSIIIIMSITYSYIEMNKRLNFNSLIKNTIISKIRKRK